MCFGDTRLPDGPAGINNLLHQTAAKSSKGRDGGTAATMLGGIDSVTGLESQLREQLKQLADRTEKEV